MDHGSILERIDGAMPGAIMDRHDFRGDLTAVVDPLRYLDVVRFIYGEGYKMLVDVTAVDWPDRRPRFDVVAHFLDPIGMGRVRLKVPVEEGRSLPSITGIHKCADWSEREVFDMFGVAFDGHPNMERLLMWDDFEGHPLRKDFPLDGGDEWCGMDTGTSYAGRAASLAE
jgi:NADH-quinone oxidoreductase subunit C